MLKMIVKIQNLSIEYDKVIIENFAVNIQSGDRIAIMGKNGSGKTVLLEHINQNNVNRDLIHIPQNLEAEQISGGENFMHLFEIELSNDPAILLLDEPTNHLDIDNRFRVIKMLKNYNGTLICVSHDPEILRLFNRFWHIDRGKITVFQGHYDDLS